MWAPAVNAEVMPEAVPGAVCAGELAVGVEYSLRFPRHGLVWDPPMPMAEPQPAVPQRLAVYLQAVAMLAWTRLQIAVECYRALDTVADWT